MLSLFAGLRARFSTPPKKAIRTTNLNIGGRAGNYGNHLGFGGPRRIV